MKVAPISAGAFRDVMARTPAAVHVVTTAGPAGRGGFTASAVASVSDAPPTILVSVHRAARSNALIRENGVMAVNLLARGQGDIADVFSGRRGLAGEARFAQGRWGTLETGAPVLGGAVATLDCRVVGEAEVATHTVFFAEVVAVTQPTDLPALVYFDRGFGGATRD